MKRFVKGLAQSVGVHLVRNPPAGFSDIFDLAAVADLKGFKTVFDVGANAGKLSLRYASAMPSSRVYAFEPFPDTRQILLSQIKGHKRIEAVALAMGEQQGQMEVNVTADTGKNSLKPGLTPANGAAATIDVGTIDGFCESRGISSIDLLKTDTEGYDMQVLRGAAGMLEKKAIRFIYSEVGFSPEDQRHTNFFEMHEYLGGFGFRFMALYEVRLRGAEYDFGNALFALQQP